MTTIDKLYREIIQYFIKNDIDNPNIDAKYLIEFFFSMSKNQFYMQGSRIVSENEYDELWKLVEKRASHYPLQYILGTQEFMGMDFKVNEDVLIPRPETEILVETVAKLCNNIKGTVDIMDMCTGSGCIAISLSKLCKESKVTGVDISHKALKVACENAEKNNVCVEFIQSDLFENVKGKFDILVSNPPYIKTSDINDLMIDVKEYEPSIALDGLEDGLFFYKKIIEHANTFLKKDAYICFEIGYDQANEVCDLLKQSEYSDIKIIKDYANLDRIVIAKCNN